MNSQEYMNEVVEALKDRSPKEIISYAIFNEKDEAEYYAKLAEKASRESIRVLFIQMSDESHEHYKELYNLFNRLYPGEEPIKLDVPPVEVAPFYPSFESVQDYLEALEYCMESELFAKRTYEILVRKAIDEDSKSIFAQLALMEEDHYNRIRRAYELVQYFKGINGKIGPLQPGAYLFDDKIKARYLFLDIRGEAEGVIFSRDPPCRVTEWMKRDVKAYWITKSVGKGAVHPKRLIDADVLCEQFNETKVILIENIEYLLYEFGFEDLMKALSLMRDHAILRNCYLLVYAKKDAFEKKEWAMLSSEFEFIP